MVTFRTLLSVAVQRNMLIKHADVKTAYLNGELEELVYMRQPADCEIGDKHCQLRKGLYGLKQSARIWNKTLDKVLASLNFKPSVNDPCLYVRNEKGRTAYLAVYVDDFVAVCHTEAEYQEIIDALNRSFQITSLGNMKHFLGIQVTRSSEGVALNQKAYIQKLLTRFGMDEAKQSKIPLDPGHLLPKEEEPVLPTNNQYASLIGGLLYVAVNTRPDVAVAVSILGRKTSCPTQSDWVEAKRILRYLKGTMDYELHLGVNSSPLEVFVDADWAGDAKDRKSTTGYLFQYAGGMVSWCSRKQDNVTLSSTEAEYVALAESCKELNWILRLFDVLGIPTKLPIKIHEDNQSCIKQIGAASVNRKSKHVETKHHFVRQLKQEGVIDPQYLPTEEMIADMMTKPLQNIKLSRFRQAAGIRSSRRSVED